MVVDIVVLRRRRAERLPTPPDAVVVDFFFTTSSFNTLFLLPPEVPPLEVEVELVSKDLLGGSDLDDESNTNGLVVDVVVSFAMIDLRDVGIFCWSLILFGVVLVSRGVSS